MAKKTTIIVEDRLRDNFNYLPSMIGPNGGSFQPVFKAGDHKELLAFFKQSQGNSNYPLVWLDMPYEEEHINRGLVKIDRLNFILAVETNSQMLYAERIDTTFKNVLIPLLDNVIDLFRVSNVIAHDNNFIITKFGNYSDEPQGEESGFTDIWDAIKLTVNITINNNCLREIKI